MKTKKKTKVQNTFICEICGKTSPWKDDIKNCEKSHNCKHKPCYSFGDASEDAWWFNVSSIEVKCELCSKDLGSVSLEDVVDNQGILKKIYALIAGEMRNE